MQVIQLKKLIAEKEGIPVPQQRLMHVGRQMDDGQTLTHYSVREDSTIQILLGLRGGFDIFIKCLTGQVLTMSAAPTDLIEDIKKKIEAQL